MLDALWASEARSVFVADWPFDVVRVTKAVSNLQALAACIPEINVRIWCCSVVANSPRRRGLP